MDTSISHILVPVDYSDKSVYGLQLAAKLNKFYKGKITVINVLKGVDPIWSDFFSPTERDDLLEKLNTHLRQFTNNYVGDQASKVECIIAKGPRCSTILETAENIGATLIVMGTSRADNIKKQIIGTNALRIVSEAKCPVITTKLAPLGIDIKRLILPLDISKETREKTVDAVNIAKKLGADIKVVSAYTFNDELIYSKLEAQLAQVVDFIKSHGVVCTGQILKVSDRTEAVLKYIDENMGDMIVITTHQQLEVVHSFMGSFAKGMISHAKVPVMSVVPKIKHYLELTLPST
jgi:nucleotide-binding universal stress UspA family protein